MKTLLENAVQSIQLGVEDYQSSDNRRILSAVRNITAGVLLLFKEKLRILSPANSDEVLLKQDIVPIATLNGPVSFVGKGKKTVNVYQIEKRFKSLGVKVDWKRFNKIIDVRNDIEHYCSSESEARLRELLSDCFVIIRDFVIEHLGREPIELLEEDTWSALLEVTEVYNKELEECRKESGLIQWDSETLEAISENIRCSDCHSQLVKPTDPDSSPQDLKFRCSSCGEYFFFDHIISELVSEHHSFDDFISIKDGGDPATTACPECYENTYIIAEDQCVKCFATRTHESCTFCSEKLGTEEQDFNGLCAHCNHVVSKED